MAAYQEVESVLASKVADKEGLAGAALIDAAIAQGAITGKVAESVRGLLELRDLVSKSGAEVDVNKAREYLALADAVIYLIEVSQPSQG